MVKDHHRGSAPPLHPCRTSSEPLKYRLNGNDPTSGNIRPALLQGGSPVDKLFGVARLVSHALSLAPETAVFKPSMATAPIGTEAAPIGNGVAPIYRQKNTT